MILQDPSRIPIRHQGNQGVTRNDKEAYQLANHYIKTSNSGDEVYLDRDGNNTVQHAKNDQSHPDQPHWEAGKTKKDESQPDGLNRSGNNNKPQIQNQGKGKSYYRPPAI